MVLLLSIDGTHYPIVKTPANEPGAPFFNRKEWKSIAGQVVIDSFFKIVQLDVGFSGNTNDVSTYNNTPFKNILMDLINRYGKLYCCIENNGYPTRIEMLTPYTGNGIMLYSPDKYEKKNVLPYIVKCTTTCGKIIWGIAKEISLASFWLRVSLRQIDFVFAICNLHNFMLRVEETGRFAIMDNN